jgi:hypothetical protein
MAFKEFKKRVDRIKLRSKKTLENSKCSQRKSKELKYDTAVPGDRGDCEKPSLTQGSE